MNSRSVWAARKSVKAVPVITAMQSAGPLVGENDVMDGGAARAGASIPSTSKDTTTPAAATRRPTWLRSAMASVFA
jgi:hypothetical protein